MNCPICGANLREEYFGAGEAGFQCKDLDHEYFQSNFKILITSESDSKVIEIEKDLLDNEIIIRDQDFNQDNDFSSKEEICKEDMSIEQMIEFVKNYMLLS